jgi:hypothetical protein
LYTLCVPARTSPEKAIDEFHHVPGEVEALICPNCGAHNPDNGFYCGSCAEPLRDISAIYGPDADDSQIEGTSEDSNGGEGASVAGLVFRTIVGIVIMIVGLVILALAFKSESGAAFPAFILFLKGLMFFVSGVTPFFVAWRNEAPSFVGRSRLSLYDEPALAEARALPLPYLAFPFTGLYLTGLLLWFRGQMGIGLIALALLVILIVTALALDYLLTGRFQLRPDGIHVRLGFAPETESWFPYDNISSIDVRGRLMAVNLLGVPRGYDRSRIYVLLSKPEEVRADLAKAAASHVRPSER